MLFVFAACAIQVDKPIKLSEKIKDKTINTQRLLILPFKEMTAIYGESSSVQCPFCGRAYLTGKVPEGSAEFLTEKLTALIKSRTTFTVIPWKQTCPVLSDLANRPGDKKSEQMFLTEAGHLADADIVLAGYIYRFKQRLGTSYAVESPASVAFCIHLFSLSEGRMLWSGHIDETQHALSENLFEIGSFFKRGASWVTMEEMAVDGLEEILKTFPKP